MFYFLSHIGFAQVTTVYIFLASTCIPFLVYAYQLRFCLKGGSLDIMLSPFKTFLSLTVGCGLNCALDLNPVPVPFQEWTPYLLSLCFMVTGNFLTKLYVDGKERGINLMAIVTGLACKLVCPIHKIPKEIQFNSSIVSWLFFGYVRYFLIIHYFIAVYSKLRIRIRYSW